MRLEAGQLRESVVHVFRIIQSNLPFTTDCPAVGLAHVTSETIHDLLGFWLQKVIHGGIPF